MYRNVLHNWSSWVSNMSERNKNNSQNLDSNFKFNFGHGCHLNTVEHSTQTHPHDSADQDEHLWLCPCPCPYACPWACPCWRACCPCSCSCPCPSQGVWTWLSCVSISEYSTQNIKFMSNYIIHFAESISNLIVPIIPSTANYKMFKFQILLTFCFHNPTKVKIWCFSQDSFVNFDVLVEGLYKQIWISNFVLDIKI